VKYACAEFMLLVLKSERSTDEALRIRRSAELYSLTDLQHEADRVIASSFASVARSTAFLESNLEEILSLLRSDYILEPNEYVFYYAAIAWIKHDLESRQRHLDVVMPCVRFPLIESHLLLNIVQKEPLVIKSELCQEFIEEAKRYQLLVRAQSTMQTERTRPRCTSRDTVVYCLSSAGHFKCYVPRYDRWYSLGASYLPDDSDHDATRPTMKHSLIVVSGVVYLCSRASRHPEDLGHLEVVQIQCFSLETNAWKLCSLPSKV
jgi:kelch repeat and BTB domain-containing protein 3